MRKSIIIVTPHYAPETNAAARRARAIAGHLASSGWGVRVITLLPHYPQNRIYEGYTQAHGSYKREGGVEILRFRPLIVQRANLFLRLIPEAAFTLKVFKRLLATDADVVLASSPYMFLGPAGLLASRLSGKKFIWDVRDLTWEYPRAAGKKTYGLDVIVQKLMQWTARQADGLMAVTEGLLDYFHKKPIWHKVLPNGIDDEWFNKIASVSLRYQHPGQQKRVLYAGLLGYNQRLHTLLHAARELPHVHFVLCGDGPERQELENKAKAWGLSNVEFLGYLSQDELAHEYARADILYAQLLSHPIHQWSEPTKIWEYMAARKPIIYGGTGSIAKLIEDKKLGMVIPPEQPEPLISAIKTLLSNYALAKDMGKNGFEYVKKSRRRSSLLLNLPQSIEKLINAI